MLLKVTIDDHSSVQDDDVDAMSLAWHCCKVEAQALLFEAAEVVISHVVYGSGF